MITICGSGRLGRATVGILVVSAALLGGCPATPPADDTPDTPEAKSDHEKVFTELLTAGYEGPASCNYCHSDRGREMLLTGHWNWQGRAVNLAGHADEIHGTQDLISLLFIAVPSNESRCAQCHPSYGWTDFSFDFNEINNIDCLVCHDTTGTYAKHPDAEGGGGRPALLLNGSYVLAEAADLQKIANNVGTPTRRNCGQCHFYSGGYDNAKHGDMSSDYLFPTAAMDVHMGGLDYACQDCHGTSSHGIAGFSIHSVNEGGARPNCTRCHTGTKVHSDDQIFGPVLNIHTKRIACETCHIPTFARNKPTLVGLYWDEAGQEADAVPRDVLGMPTYDINRGRLVWKKDIVPSYRWFNGQWRRKIINSNDTYASAGTEADPVVLAEPVGSLGDSDAKIFPFKRMVGRMPVDTANQRLIVPHLFGDAAGDRPFWGNFDWAAALSAGAAYAGQPYSGQYGFVDVVQYFKLSHEVAPPDQALQCDDCHGVDGWFESLGYEKDPWGT